MKLEGNMRITRCDCEKIHDIQVWGNNAVMKDVEICGWYCPNKKNPLKWKNTQNTSE